MNRIDKIFKSKKALLSIYFTAGYPQLESQLESTKPVIKALQESGADILEIGLPFSDPLADGDTIQKSSTIALQNGMRTETLFKQLYQIRPEIHLPLIIMGYFNPILQYGLEKFCLQCKKVGIDGVIIPDLPVDIYNEKYKSIFEANNLYKIFLVTPQTSVERIKYIDSVSKGFIYLVSTSSTTGKENEKMDVSYFQRVASMGLKNPLLIGFGISTSENYKLANKYAQGAIIGSAFIRFLAKNKIKDIKNFITTIKK